MPSIRPAQITNDPFSVWANQIQDSIAEKDVSISSDFIQKSGPAGKFISLHPKHKYTPNYPTYKGEWNISASYQPNDIVRVLPGKDYTRPPNLIWIDGPDKLGVATSFLKMPIGWNNLNGDNVYIGRIKFINGETGIILPNYNPIPGTYICVSNVPSWELSTLVPSVLNLATFNSINQMGSELYLISNINYIRFWDVNYFPGWPERPNIAYVDPNDLTKANGRYWDLISLLPSAMLVCSNGMSDITYADNQTVPTGSANYTGSI
jgi:hypothetical protein